MRMTKMAGRVELDFSSNLPPYCIHGPTLLFRRFYQKKQSRNFYACSVYRNRKGCQFFHYEDEPLSEEKREHYLSLFRDHQQSLTQSQTVSLSLHLLPHHSIGFCIDCSLLYERDKDDECKTHADHSHRERVTEKELQQPTTLLYPLSDNKGQAQYFFSDKTQSFLLSELKRLAVSHVICLGVPRFYETLSASGMKGFLLDIDHRYFYGQDVFQRFNMFNGFFYSGEEGEQSLKRFVQSVPKENILLIVDPPFGGLLNALKTGVEVIWKLLEHDTNTLLVFPYFNESHVLESFTDFVMLDYQVTYGNHRYYGERGKRGKPSPVRVFTNLPLPGLVLPNKEGYQYCSICKRYVSPLNKHCAVCDSCTSKDGRLYRHCYQCGICVKQSQVHCLTCASCQLPQHDCQRQLKSGCYICGGEDHKKRHCPSHDKKSLKRKRNTVSVETVPKKVKL